MKQQRCEKSEKRKSQKRKSKRRESQEKEDQRARKGTKVPKPCVFSLHVCVGFLFLVVHFRLAPPGPAWPRLSAARRLLTHTQLVTTQLDHTQLDP